MPRSIMRTLRLKVREESYGWLNAAAVEVNEVFNYCNESSFKAATRSDTKRKWLTGFDLCNLTAGAAPHFERIGAATIQSICNHYAQKRQAARRLKLRWRVSRGPRRSLGWIPFKAASLKRKGAGVRFAGKCFRKFSRSIVDRYQNIIVGDVSSSKRVKTRMAKSVLDSGWAMLKRYLEYKSQQAARSFEVVSERNTSVTCSACGALSGPRGINGLTVRSWVCGDCGESHDRDVNAARHILIGSRCRTSVRGNEPSTWVIPPSRVYRARAARIQPRRRHEHQPCSIAVQTNP
jgi:IS605 OrfB family transposase